MAGLWARFILSAVLALTLCKLGSTESSWMAAIRVSLDPYATYLPSQLFLQGSAVNNYSMVFVGDSTNKLYALDVQNVVTMEPGVVIGFKGLKIYSSLGAVPYVDKLSRLNIGTDIPASPPAPNFLRLPWLSSGSNLLLQNVVVFTSCESLNLYKQYICGGAWTANTKVNNTHIHIAAWESLTVQAFNVSITTEAQDCPGYCTVMPISTAEEFYQGHVLQSTYDQVVMVLIGNISLQNAGSWATTSNNLPVKIYKLIVLVGQPGLVYDVAQRVKLMQIAPTGLLIHITVTTIGAAFGNVESLPLNYANWNLLSAPYITIPDSSQPYVFAYNITAIVACDFLEYAFIWIGRVNSTSSLLSQSALWVKPLAAGAELVGMSEGILFKNVRGVLGRSTNFWAKCSNALRPELRYSGIMSFSVGGALPLPQIFGVSNATSLMNHILYAQQRAQTFKPDKYALVLLNNISFADWANAGSSPLLLNTSLMISKAGTMAVYLDFAYNTHLFEIPATVRVELRNLTLLRLPVLRDERLISLWGPGLWPFVFDRGASSRLTLTNVTLQVTQDEMDMLALLVHHSEDVDGQGPTSLNSLSTMHIAGKWLPGGMINNSGHLAVWELTTLDGFGYETAGIILAVSPAIVDPTRLTRPKSAYVEAPSLSTLESLYGLGSAAEGPTDDSSSSSSSLSFSVGALVGVVVGSVVGVAVIIVGAFVLFRWRQARKQGPASKGIAPIDSKSKTRKMRVRAPDRPCDLRMKCAAAVASCPLQINDHEVEIQEMLGKGGTGMVYKALWSGKQVAVKIIPLDKTTQCKSALREVRLPLQLSHPLIVATYAHRIKEIRVTSGQLCAVAVTPSQMDAFNHHQPDKPKPRLPSPRSALSPPELLDSKTGVTAKGRALSPSNSASNVHSKSVKSNTKLPPSCNSLTNVNGIASGTVGAKALSPSNSASNVHSKPSRPKALASTMEQSHDSSLNNSPNLMPPSSFNAGVEGGTASGRAESSGSIVALNLSGGNVSGNGKASPSAGSSSGQQAVTLKTTPDVVQLHVVVILQEYCDVGALGPAIDRGILIDKDTGGIDWKLLLVIAKDVAKAMAHIHSKSIIHGDLTPNNVLLQTYFGLEEEEEEGAPSSPLSQQGKIRAKVADFGLSATLQGSQSHLSNIMAGTLFYMAPEVYMAGQLARAADVYAFGVILWELYHGTPPWRKAHTHATSNAANMLCYDKACPHWYVELCRWCTDLKPEHRPTFSELLRQLEEEGAGVLPVKDNTKRLSLLHMTSVAGSIESPPGLPKVEEVAPGARKAAVVCLELS